MQLEFISAKSTFAVDGGGGRRGSLKSKRKQTGGESGQGYLYVCSVKKKLPHYSNRKQRFCCFEPIPALYKGVFLLKKRKIFLFFHSDGELFLSG